ncbi:MAG TPA: class I adenylate-forming enzyme family protein [Polyangia bacterium]|nr:class I adenylate-forming enzyme family protein [Polyangia bacterium]
MLLYRWLKDVTDERGSAKALVYRDTYLSWRGLLHRVDRRAQEFQAMGIQKGDWVGLMLGNVPDFVILALALSKLDACLIPLDPTTGTRELEMVLDAAPMRGLITRPRGGDTPQQPSGTLPPPRSVKAQPPKPTKPSQTPESRRRLQGTLLTCSIYKRATRPDSGEAPRVILFTTDVGGDPKGVLRTSGNLEASTKLITSALEMTPNDRILTAVPLYHAYGFDFGLLPGLKLGATLYLEDEVAPRRIAKVLREQEISIVPGTPTVYQQLAKIPTARALRTRGARFLSGGSRLEEQVAEAFRARYGQRLISVYHTTEAGVVAIDRRGQSPESVGKVVDGVEVRLTNAQGAPLAAGADKGVIWVHSTAVSPGAVGPHALKQPKARRGAPAGERDSTGWYRTGDLGRFDRSGRLFLEGREDDLVKVDGKRVALGEVEGCLESFPKVKEAQALVIQDPLGGPMVIARVVPLGRCKAEEIIDHCARNLAPYKVPRRIEFCESLGN